MANKLLEKIEIIGVIELLTGLHIGGTNSSMSIGGIDKAVIRNPLTNQPFIPGSSLKGKMRSLLEISLGQFDYKPDSKIKYNPSKEGIAAELFGNAVGGSKQRPSRLIVRDCKMTNADYVLSKTELPYTEGKTEVIIDRITSEANPRQNERVPAGAKFSLNLVVNIWEQDNSQRDLVEVLFETLILLQDDYLGGHGSRGYDQIGFEIHEVLEKSVTDYYGKADAQPVSVKEKYQQYIEKLEAKKEVYAD